MKQYIVRHKRFFLFLFLIFVSPSVHFSQTQCVSGPDFAGTCPWDVSFQAWGLVRNVSQIAENVFFTPAPDTDSLTKVDTRAVFGDILSLMLMVIVSWIVAHLFTRGIQRR